MVLTFFLLTIGFFILRVEFPLLLGALIALVDALPMLGTGTVLVPWGLLVMLQGQTALGLGLIALYGVTSLTRSILEPRMVGRQLGLNPLLTLVALYMGYRLWGDFRHDFSAGSHHNGLGDLVPGPAEGGQPIEFLAMSRYNKKTSGRMKWS